ncbi:MAG: hypothetical protein NZT92_17870 [Abditibacteriales bacterium]|nr:hypothetical protein [Abditibacteriales bacterium]MDW8366416.1 hypothetical protein [Abditibacteriales bacterium]
MDFMSMFVLAMVMFGIAYFVLHSLRRRGWQEFEREMSQRKPTDATAHRPNLLCLECGAMFDVESIVRQPGEMTCLSCGKKDAMVWLSNEEETAKHRATPLPEKRQIASEDEPPSWSLPLF